MVLEIERGIVIIAGPAAAGKTTLAQRILEGCPWINKRLVSFPNVLLDSTNGGTKIGDAGLSAQISCVHDMIQADKVGAFTVCDGCYLTEVGMSCFLYRLKMARIKSRITLIKLALRPELRHEYLKKRGGGILSPNLVEQQYKEFTEVIRHDYRSEMGWVSQEYFILNPDQVELKFP